MNVDCLSWDALHVSDLETMILERLVAERSDFLADVQRDDLHDTDERFASISFLDGLRQEISSWCDHFDLTFDGVKGYDRHCYPGSAAGPMSWHTWQINFNELAAQIAAGINAFSSDRLGIYRPKVFETAGAEVMKWLQTRPEYVDRVHPRSFEAIVAEVIKDRGWQVELTKQTRDGGYDILAITAPVSGLSIKILVECKLFNIRRPVGLPMVDRLMGVVNRENADGGVLVTNSRFSSTAWELWESRVGRDLELVDREELFEWLKAFRRVKD